MKYGAHVLQGCLYPLFSFVGIIAFLNGLTERKSLLSKEKPHAVQRNIKYRHANFHNCRCCGYLEKCITI